MNEQQRHPVERITAWVGSVPSLALHTLVFITFFILSFAGFLSWDLMFLILTTVVSLEAIYLAIFIQMTVNRQAESLREVEADIDEIQEDVEEMSGDLEEMSDDEREETRKRRQVVALETITHDVHKILADLEQLSKGK